MCKQNIEIYNSYILNQISQGPLTLRGCCAMFIPAASFICRSFWVHMYRCFMIFDLGTRCYSQIGFVGLGNMGGHMARNLLTKVNVRTFPWLLSAHITIGVTYTRICNSPDLSVVRVTNSPCTMLTNRPWRAW